MRPLLAPPVKLKYNPDDLELRDENSLRRQGSTPLHVICSLSYDYLGTLASRASLRSILTIQGSTMKNRNKYIACTAYLPFTHFFISYLYADLFLTHWISVEE